VRDRMERAGMKWTRQGASAMLQLRTVRLNGDWAAYQRLHRHRVHLRLYGRDPFTDHPELHALAQAA
jgi:hypothetical protein